LQVKLTQISHTFDQKHYLFRDLSYTFSNRIIYGITGPSGSGKSTILNIIAQMLKPTQGEVELNGINSVRWVFQNPLGFPERTVLDHIVLPLVGSGLSRGVAEKNARNYLRSFKMDNLEQQLYKELSGGQAQRLMLIDAIASGPDLLLIDEPTAQLDNESAAEVIEILRKLSNQDLIVILASHDGLVIKQCGAILDLQHLTSRL
jgi:ABC-type lipoprotein export system ATPase subunit